MDDKIGGDKRIRLPFPNVGQNSDHLSQSYDGYLNTSLVHENEDDKASQLHPRGMPQQPFMCRIFLGMWQQPIGKLGLIVLLMGSLLFAVASTASLLSWIGALGVVTGASLLGLSLFSTCLKTTRTPTVENEGGPRYGGLGSA